MNAKYLLFILAACFLFSQTGYANEAAVQARVKNARAEFAQTLRQHPNTEVRAIAFFNKSISLDEVRDTITDDVVVEGFRHGTSSHAGGYMLQSNETLDEAVENYRQDHETFLNLRMQHEQRMLDSEQDESIRGALGIHIQRGKQMERDFKRNGIRVVGIELRGAAKDVDRVRARNNFVRVIELKKKGRVQPALMPE